MDVGIRCSPSQVCQRPEVCLTFCPSLPVSRYPAAVKSNDNPNRDRDPNVLDGPKLGDSGRQDMWGGTSPAQLCNFRSE